MYLEEDELPLRSHKKKSTRRWCKGHVGKKHDPTLALDHRYATLDEKWAKCDWYDITFYKDETRRRYSCKHVEVCKNCGKVLRWYLTEGECPDYVRN